MPSLLLLQLKRIGDAVLTAPVLGALRAGVPGIRITLVLAEATGELGPLFAQADEVLVWRGGKLNLSLLHRVWELHPDVVLDFTGTDRSALLSLLSGAAVRVGYEKFTDRFWRRMAYTATCLASVRELHTLDFHLALAVAAGLRVAAVPDAGHLVLPSGLVLPELPSGYIVVHPGSAREEKFWGVGHWIALLDYLNEHHAMPIVLTGGEGAFEEKQITDILSGTKAPVCDLRGKLSLAQLSGVIADASLAITVDTAAMHLAASFGVPQVALFGPTNPFHWAPRLGKAVVLQAGRAEGSVLKPKQAGAPMASLTWETVAGVVDRLLVQAG